MVEEEVFVFAVALVTTSQLINLLSNKEKVG
jgi:hypothetical protein